MITKAAECSINIYMRCMWGNDRTDVENFEKIHDEYMDLSGLAETEQKDVLIAMHNLTVRILVIPAMIKFQCDYFAEYKEPYVDGFGFFKKYGHTLTWELGEAEQFYKQLEKIESKEKKYESQLDILKKQFNDLQKGGKVIAKKNGRQEFIKLINRVGKYKDIDRDKVDMETFGLMVKDYFEINDPANKPKEE